MIKIPNRFEHKLNGDQYWDGIVKSASVNYSKFLFEHNLEFFPEYTNHGIKHIEEVLIAADNLITETTFQNIITPKDVAILILATIVHDSGMHLNIDLFYYLIEHSEAFIENLDKSSWKREWAVYLEEVKKFSGKQKKYYLETNTRYLKYRICLIH